MAILRLWPAPTNYWHWRDDAVITLSHSYGWVLNGAPSVSSSGERTEGFSAPLQFLLASVWYSLGGSGWKVLLDAQVMLGIAFTGYFLGRFLQYAASSAKPFHLVLGVLATASMGLLPWNSVGWLASGMENSLLLPLLASAMACFAAVASGKQGGWALGMALGLAGTARSEWFALLLPAMGVIALMGWKGPIARIAALRASALAVIIWGSVLTLRFVVFGSVVPNSAVVQSKSSVSVLGLVGIAAFVALLALTTYKYRNSKNAKLPTMLALGATVMLLALLGANEMLGLNVKPVALVSITLGYVVVAVSLAIGRCGSVWIWIGWGCLAASPVLQFALFGPARLDSLRVVAVSWALMASSVGVLVLALAGKASRKYMLGNWSASWLFTAMVGAGLAFVGSLSISQATNLCCDIGWANRLLSLAEDTSERSGLPRVILANPDLGKVSFPKETVTADLGLLGDPLLAQVTARDPKKTLSLLNEVTVPDLVAIHGVWLCRYDSWVQSEAFKNRYRLRVDRSMGEVSQTCVFGGEMLIAERRLTSDQQVESQLARALSAGRDSPNDIVNAALEECIASDGAVFRCQWVRRAIQRSAPELRNAGFYDEVVDLVKAESPTGYFDGLLLETPPGWSDEAANWAVKHLSDSPLTGSLDNVGG